MRPLGWFGLRLALVPLARRKSRALVSVTALMLGAALVTALLTIYGGVAENLSQQFRRYGANLVVTPGDDALTLGAQPAQAALAALPDGVGVLYDVAQCQGQSLAVAGADLAALRRMNASWKITGRTPGAGEAWIGVNAARALHAGAGTALEVTLNGRSAHWRVAGTVQAGTSEDNQVMVPYAQMAELAGISGYTTLQFHISGGNGPMAQAEQRLQRLLPAARVQPVRPITAGEGAILLSTRRMVLATSLLILLTVGLCVAAALTTLALERRSHFGLMKALGGTERGIMALFVGEAALLGVVAAAGGMVLGSLLAAGIGRALFGLWLAPELNALAAALGLTLAMAMAAALLPWPVIRAATPAAMLRGE
ncbi:MAG: ABC transporter permease [Terriglobales bacterium]